MGTYVLVPGAWHGAWCWYRILPRLRTAGHEASAVDLPALGRDTTPVERVSLQTWVDWICDIVTAEPEPVILVGHSRAGILLSSVAERCPDRIASLVYVAAALVRDGEAFRELLVEDGTSDLLPHMEVAEDGSSVMVREEAIGSIFYGESSEEDVALARSLVRPEPYGPSGTHIHVTEERFGTVPRTYIECLRDRTVPPLLQRKMYTATPCQQVMTIDTDHSPFFSAPEKLTECLLSVRI